MEIPETIRISLQLGEWVTSIDFREAYFHVPIHSQSRKYMRFHIQGQSYQFKALPFGLSTAPMEFTVVAKEVKLMALPRGIRIHQYLDDWLVRATSHQTCQSPAYTDLGSSLSRIRLAGEQGEVRTGSKTGFQLRRLPVRPQGGQGQAHSRVLADLNRQNIVNSVRSGVPGPAVHVPDRTSNSHRKASPSRSTSYETHTVAPEEQLEGTRITRKGDTRLQVAPPHLRWWLEESNVLPGQPLHPLKHAVQIFTDASKEGWGAHLNERTARGTWSLSESKLHINHLELKAVFLTLKEFQDLCSNNIVLVATDNTTVIAYINKEGGMKSGSLCALLWRILSWCTRERVPLKARHIPGRLNVIADTLFRLGQTIQTEWSVTQKCFKPYAPGGTSPKWTFWPPDSTTNSHSLCHQFQTPRLGQWMHSACLGKIWTHMPSHQQPSWAKWWRSYRTTPATEEF